jgi:hypothetical protein
LNLNNILGQIRSNIENSEVQKIYRKKKNPKKKPILRDDYDIFDWADIDYEMEFEESPKLQRALQKEKYVNKSRKMVLTDNTELLLNGAAGFHENSLGLSRQDIGQEIGEEFDGNFFEFNNNLNLPLSKTYARGKPRRMRLDKKMIRWNISLFNCI